MCFNPTKNICFLHLLFCFPCASFYAFNLIFFFNFHFVDFFVDIFREGNFTVLVTILCLTLTPSSVSFSEVVCSSLFFSQYSSFFWAPHQCFLLSLSLYLVFSLGLDNEAKHFSLCLICLISRVPLRASHVPDA